jgi:hypothetical protein
VGGNGFILSIWQDDLANNWTEAMNPFFHAAFMLR